MISTDILLNVATAAQLFHATDATPYADLIIDGHRETWPVRGKRFCAWLRQQYYERTWDAPSPGALNAALNVIEAQAQFDGPERKISVRLAEHDGLFYLDLADEFWRCIEIGPRGALWQEFELARPQILGALLDTVRRACAHCPAFASSGCRTLRSGGRCLRNGRLARRDV